MPVLPSVPRRAICPHCLRPASACVCTAIRRVAHRVEVLILMHPDEVGHAKGTGQLLHLCLPNSRMEVGETFDAELLHAPWNSSGEAVRPWLLYPGDAEGQQDPGPAHSPAACTRLVVLDATWRHSRQMLRANPLLARLPRLALADVPASRYAIRKAHAEHQLSTLEAVHLALKALDPGGASRLDALSEAMDGFLDLQRPYWPHAR
ncbi:DTW domain-containing protein [Diaphorobacter ruginosibacter]|uniref:tRNA-uridine aminocarboxypropyltransferase n=1 Tax=Diaphorobacter ruginosibacter TaxID=1715720 RepID=A0A7G9RVF6_9BURK|nr:DTW domain-containing protein [Diaphorobacter ruginosibacter]